ncbi:cholinesterase-like [Asterias amurensis]|uniref:cholinesterase-like n=1 Tax=Asterias amurensis TaxID=7602 RepID=UPI003AB2B907
MVGQAFPVSVAFFLGLLVGFEASQPQVTVEQGPLFGTTETFQEDEFINITKNIDVFKGIPFAEPPVGALRFRAPVEKSSWGSEVYNATYFRAACVQDSAYVTPYGLQMGEDCLHVNIYAPNPKLPEGAAVMVYMHGGGLKVGSGSLPDLRSQPLVAIGDVILVTLNYRLNVIGFLTTGDEVSPGNAGLKDQALALQWIKKNIEAFGGDSERITIFGESAGSNSVSAHLLAKQNEGLFHQAIMQSGNVLAEWSFQENQDIMRQQAFLLGAQFGCTAEDTTGLVECLREQDPTALFTTSEEIAFLTALVVDGEYIEDKPPIIYSTGQYNHVDILLGTNADEGAFMMLYDSLFFPEYFLRPDPPFVTRDNYEEIINRQVELYYGGNTQIADAIRLQYVDWSQADNVSADYFEAVKNFYTDFFFTSSTDLVARYHVQGGNAVYMYQMTHVPSASYWDVGVGVGPGWLGACHAEDVLYVFGVPFIPEAAVRRNEFQDAEKALSVKFMEFWTNFVNTGNPGTKTPGSSPASEDDYWPEFTIPELGYKELNVTMATGRALKSNEAHFWNSYVVQLQTMLADMETSEREWRESYSAWKYTDMADWREQFNQYKSATGNY